EEVSDRIANIGWVRTVQRTEVVCSVRAISWRIRHAILPTDDGCDTLAQHCALHLSVEHAPFTMRMRVNESRHHDARRRIDHLVVCTRRDDADRCDASALDRDIRETWGTSAAV